MSWHPDMPEEYKNQIVTGDALELMKRMPDKSIDVILTDPPYFLPAMHYQTRVRHPRSLSDLSILEFFFDAVFEEINRILKSSGIMMIFCDGQSYPVMYVKTYKHFSRLTEVVWDKGQIGMGRGFRRRHELILICINEFFEWNNWAPSVLEFKPVRSQDRIHPAEKPVPLFMKLLLLVSPSGIVCDPFIGSGSVAVAAKLVGHNFIGFELDPNYAELARKRVLNTQPPLFVMEPEQKELGL